MEYKKYLIAVSGGADSMFLLNKYKNKNIIVAHVNYNQREDSIKDEKTVTNFCKKYNLTLEKLILKKEDYSKGNFQNWAREIRYQFFKKIYDKYNCNVLLVAHNLDDYLETAQLQNSNNRINSHLGMQKKIFLYGMNIYRPLLFRYFKDTILKKCIRYKIPYYIDSSNNTGKYARNIIRKQNKELTKLRKLWILYNIYLKNKKIKEIDNKANIEYKIWREANFKQEIFEYFKFKDQVIFKLIHYNFTNIELSKNKINALKQFILSKNRTSKFKLDEKNYLSKKKGQIFIVQ
ncbi:tRNA(Ile)-lysidine synthase [Mycoplasmopsis mustelae]|uniref:tRNA(Ile)-lysidine synthase n=1 Tax=Mycoplasmopsis mustelae TaxID=171289 RepID=A0A4V3FP01_9BACT|nr:tRNA lysidine(34) synthetase TilS [Mycoplasmopsis mustelae]TDV24400.1 tRNA(Ile)-lysidine synthase [Mycoplasmopsis mustelae]